MGIKFIFLIGMIFLIAILLAINASAAFSSIAVNQYYSKSSAPAAGYPDTNNGGREATDNSFGNGYGSGLTFGYDLGANNIGATVDVNITFDFGVIKNLSRADGYFYTSADYAPSWVKIWTSFNNSTWWYRGQDSAGPKAGWYNISLDNMRGRWVKFEAYKIETVGYYDWLFFDELRIWADNDYCLASTVNGKTCIFDGPTYGSTLRLTGINFTASTLYFGNITIIR
jgi:hypothetical protein